MRFADTPLVEGIDSVGRADHPESLVPALRPAFLAVGEARHNLDRLFEPGTFAITTGQQPGLFTGPLYTIYKALSAAALAQSLEAEWHRPVVPVFWLANDDHDYTEARGTSWLNLEGELVRGELSEREAEAPLTPMYRFLLGQEVERLLERFAADQPVGSHREETVEWLSKHYRSDATMGGAFSGAMAELLGRFGVVCFDSTHRAAKVAMAPRIISVVQDAAVIYEKLAAERDALLERQHTTSVIVAPGATLAFLEDDAGRDRIMVDGGGYVTRRAGKTYDLADLQEIAAHEPTRLSPNVLLRPVLESALLPTVAYVAGPGEMSYLPLCAPIYQHLGVHQQTPVARWSGLAVEPRVDRVLRKFGATLDDLAVAGRGLERRVVSDRMPARLVEGIATLRSAMETGYRVVQEGAVEIDPTLERLVGAAHGRARAELDRVERKAEQHLRRREVIELAQIERARVAVRPEGAPQERVLSVPGFLARYGPSFLDEAFGQVSAWYGRALVSRTSTS